MKQRVYLTCPMCGWVRPTRYSGPRSGHIPVRFDKVDVTQVEVWQIKEMGGYASGFHKIEGKKLHELSPELKNQIRQQCLAILGELGE